MHLHTALPRQPSISSKVNVKENGHKEYKEFFFFFSSVQWYPLNSEARVYDNDNVHMLLLCSEFLLVHQCNFDMYRIVHKLLCSTLWLRICTCPFSSYIVPVC